VFNEDNPVLGVAIAAVRELEVNVIATSGPGTGPRASAQPPHMVIEPYLPQALVLPACAFDRVTGRRRGVMLPGTGSVNNRSTLASYSRTRA